MHTEYYEVADWINCADHFNISLTNASTNGSDLTCSEIKDELEDMDLTNLCPTKRSKTMVSRSGMNILGIYCTCTCHSFFLLNLIYHRIKILNV